MERAMSTAATKAWALEKQAHPRSAYIAGYDRGAFDERLRLVAFIGENQEVLTEFAGDRGMELLAYMLRELAPVSGNSGAQL